jgi:hypothetical protein
MIIHPVGTELFYADRRTDIRKLTVTYRNFTSPPIECSAKTHYIEILKKFSQNQIIFYNISVAATTTIGESSLRKLKFRYCKNYLINQLNQVLNWGCFGY